MKNLTLQRVAAVDVFRALTMFLMLFVNDIPGLKNVPHWLMHAAADEDMLGFSDTIFPAFLFCMGMSVSFAIQNRYKKGDTTTQVIAHIFWRTVALIAMGLFSLNSGGIEGGLSHSWFTILMVIGFFLTWGVYPKAEGTKKALFTVMKVAGVVLLATLVIYKDLNGKPFHTSWWGILGLIGWTYAVCAGVAAVDVFRALTMFLMLFVNDIPGLKNVPHWLMHAAADEDMLGFSDTIFPAFLFCMGMSVSFAIQNRYKKGDTTTQVIAHIFWRTVALIAMGLFSLNSGGIEGGLSHSWFTILMVIGFFLTWGVYPKAEGTKKALFTVMKVAGVVLLATLVIYKDLNGKPFHTSWWGILGLIGWTYAVCAGIYLFTRESLRKNAVAWFAVITLAVISHSGLIPEEYGSRILLLPFIPSDWTLHAFGMSGLLTSLLMQRYANREHPGKFIGMLCILGAGMLILALVSHPYWIISKIQATPSWLFYCLAAFFPLFGFFYWLTDVKGKTNRFDIIKPAGTATLTCYILPYIWYSVQQLAGWAYPEALGSGVPGLLKSLVFSIIIVQLTGLLVKSKIKLKV